MRVKGHAPLLVSLAVLLSGLVILVGLVTDENRRYSLQKFAASEIGPRLSSEPLRYVPGEIIVKRVGQAPQVESVPIGAEEAQVQLLEGEASVEYAEPNYLFYPQAITIPPNDARYGDQWYLSQIKAEGAWQLVQQGGVERAAGVALIDTGVDCTHLDLQGPCRGDDNSATGSLHGTNVAGTINTVTNNGLGLSSLSWGAASIESINVCQDVGGQVGCPADKIAAGIRGASSPIINISLGGTTNSHTVREAIFAAHQTGKLLIAAAGNSGDSTYIYPAAYPQVMAVASSSASDTRAPNSSYGNHVDVAAPGEAVLTTCVGDYCEASGTSLASGLASSLASLVWGQDGTLSAARVRAIVQDSADSADYVYFGRINAERALGQVIFIPTPTPSPRQSPTPTLGDGGPIPTATPINFPPQANGTTATPGPTFNPPTGTCEELKNAGVSVLTNPHCAFLELQNLVVLFLNIAIPFAAIAALAFILMGGFFYVTAGPNPDKAESARGTITWAVIGLVVALSAWLIMKLVVGGFGNIPGLSIVPIASAQEQAQFKLSLTADRQQAQANGEDKVVLTAQLSQLVTPTPTSVPTATPEVFEPLVNSTSSLANHTVTFEVTGEGVNLRQLDAVTDASGTARAELTATAPGEKIISAAVGSLSGTRRERKTSLVVSFTTATTIRGVSLEKSTVGVDPGVVRICGENPLMNQTSPCGGSVEDPTVANITVNLVDKAGNPVTNVVPEVRASGRMNQLVGNQLTSNYAEQKTITASVNGVALKDAATVEFVSAIAGARRAVVDQTLDLTSADNKPFKMFAHKQIFKVKVNQPETVSHVVVEFNCKFNGRGLSHGRFIVTPPPDENGLLKKAVDWMAMGGPADPATDTPENGDCELTTQVYRKAQASANEPEPEPIPEPPVKKPVEPIDPFGVVTNAETGAAVVGATVTLYEWNEANQDWQLWPGAKNNNQANPQSTDTFGQYSFLVLPGKYYLTIERENFEAFTSDVIEVVEEPVRADVQLMPKTAIWAYVLIGGVSLLILTILWSLINRLRKRRALASLTEGE